MAAAALALSAAAAAAAPAALSPAAVEAELAEAARLRVLEQADRDGLQSPQASVSLRPMPGAKALPSPCRPPLAVEALDTRSALRMRFGVRCADADSPRREYQVRAELSAEVLVAAVALPAGHALAEADVLVERRELSMIADALSDPQAVVGLSSRRPLTAGQVLQKRQLVEPLLVRRGQAVAIVARNGPVEVSAAGEAMEAGKLDDVVRVRNTATGRVIRARVTAASTVEPAELPMPSSR